MAAASWHVTACVEEELDLQRLNSIHDWLWIAGRPMLLRALHYQFLLRREIFIAERMDMHLVRTAGRIFLKPVPRFLLEPRFWAEYLCCGHACGYSMDGDAIYRGPPQECKRRGLRKRALSFLFSYAAPISRESDFCIAEEKRLLPPGVQPPAWRMFVEQLGTDHIYPNIDPRFYYRELRPSRLNKICRLWRTPPRGYISHWNRYGAFFRDHFAWLAGTTVYLVVVLTAIQVGLATESLEDNDAFQSSSYGFTVFSILGPLVCAGLIVLAFFYIFVHNWIATAAYQKMRLRHIGKRTKCLT